MKNQIPSLQERVELWDALYQKDGKRYGKYASDFCRLMYPYVELNKPKNILEIGCGYGRDLFFVANRIGMATFAGIDFSQAAISLLNHENSKMRLSNLKGLIGDFLDLKADNISYECIYSHFFIHLFLNREIDTILAKTNTLLKEKGIFISSCISQSDTKYGRGSCIDNSTFACYSDKPWHFLNFWNESKIHNKFKASGFNIEVTFEYIEKEKILNRVEETRSWFIVARKER